ncbi:MAG: hypothetical protein H5U33_07240, partial [Pseudomonas sp.]|nr:hypothetical protein [Pseudomonas sp.]
MGAGRHMPALQMLLYGPWGIAFGLDGRSYDVIAQSPRDQRLTPQALTRQYV